MSTKSTEFLHHMTPHACTQDPQFFSHKLLSKRFEIKPQLMMAAATWLPSVGFKTWRACRQSVCIVCSTIREVTKPLITKKITDYRPSVPGPTYLEHFFLITCTTCFTRLLTQFRCYIQRLVSMSITDGLVSTNLLLLYILAIYLHIYVLCFKNIRYIWIPTKTVGDLVYIPHQNICSHYCPACRTTFIATRFRVAVICPIIPVPHCIRVFFYFVWFVFINHIFQFYYELYTYCNILDIYLS